MTQLVRLDPNQASAMISNPDVPQEEKNQLFAKYILWQQQEQRPEDIRAFNAAKKRLEDANTDLTRDVGRLQEQLNKSGEDKTALQGQIDALKKRQEDQKSEFAAKSKEFEVKEKQQADTAAQLKAQMDKILQAAAQESARKAREQREREIKTIREQFSSQIRGKERMADNNSTAAWATAITVVGGLWFKGRKDGFLEEAHRLKTESYHFERNLAAGQSPAAALKQAKLDTEGTLQLEAEDKEVDDYIRMGYSPSYDGDNGWNLLSSDQQSRVLSHYNNQPAQEYTYD